MLCFLNLFSSDSHVIFDVREDSWLDEEAVSRNLAATCLQLCTFLFAGLDELKNLSCLLSVDLNMHEGVVYVHLVTHSVHIYVHVLHSRST